MQIITPPMHTLHIVCGLPASGKTTFSKQLAKDLIPHGSAALLDSDTATDLMIQAAHQAAGLDPHDRNSPLYKLTYREPVYDTLFALAYENLPHTNVILAGPFTSELKDKAAWQQKLETQFPNANVVIHHIEITEEERITRMKHRGALRDQAKPEMQSNP